MVEGQTGAEGAREPIPRVLQLSFVIIVVIWYVVPFLARAVLPEPMGETAEIVAATSFWPLVGFYFVLILFQLKGRESPRVLGYGGTLIALGFLKPFLMLGSIGILEVVQYAPPESTFGIVRNVDIQNLDRSGSDPCFTPFVDYEYRVDNRTFNKREALTEAAAATLERAKELTNSYIDEHDRVVVHYLPRNPSECSLDRDWSPLLGYLALLTFGFAALGTVIFALDRYQVLPIDFRAFLRRTRISPWERAFYALGLVACGLLFIRSTSPLALIVAAGIVVAQAARNKRLYHLLFGVAALLFLFSVLLHLGTFFGLTPFTIEELMPLHLLIFVLVIPLLFAQSRRGENPLSGRGTRDLVGAAPAWMKALIGMLFVYAIFNFFFCTFYLLEGASVGVVEGRRALHDHGRILRVLDDGEYELMQDYGFRGLSGHWMVFFAAEAAAFYSALRLNQREEA